MGQETDKTPIFLMPGDGRDYDMGRIQARFKADGDETPGRSSISEWRMEPNTKGIGTHSHAREDEISYVPDGTMSFLVGDEWRNAGPVSFVFVPAGVVHDFENRSDQRAGVLNVFAPGAFEGNMPMIVDWFTQHPPEDARYGRIGRRARLRLPQCGDR